MKYRLSYLLCCFAISTIAICVFKPQGGLAETLVEENDSGGELESSKESTAPKLYSRSKALLWSLIPSAGGS